MTTPTDPTDPTDPSDPNYDISLNPPDFAFAASLDKLVGESATKALGVRATDPYAELFVETWKDRNIGDIIRLKIQDKDGKGDLLVASVTVSEIASRYSLMVPRKDLQDRVLVGQQEGLVTMYLELVRVGSKQISRSRSVTFLLKKSSPAGFDSRPDVEGHDGLRVVAEGLPQYSTVDSYVASKGMWVLLSKHANARANDLFTIFLAGVPTPYRLSAAEAAGPGPYRVFIPPSVFRDITQFGLLPLLYTVEDVAENPPAGNTKLSAPYYLNSDLDPSLFDPPYLLVNNVETTRLNLGTQGSLPFSVSVTPPRSIRLASPPNQIVVTLTFTKNEGTKKVTRLPSFAQTQARGEIIPVSSEVFNQPGFDFVHISYEMFSSTGALLGKSGSTSVSLEGVLVVTYPAPAFDGKLGPQTIVPQNYPNGATTTVGFPSMSTAHVIQLIWRYFDGTVAVIPAQTGNANGLVQFPISATIIAQSAGQPIKLSYLVTVGGTTVASEVQVLTVQATSTADYPRAFINGIADGGTLELKHFAGDAYIAITKWPFSAAGQVFKLELNSEGVVPLTVRSDYRISESEAQTGLANLAVSRNWLNSVPHGNKIIITCSIDTNGQTIVFPQTTYLLSSPLRIDSSPVTLSGQSILLQHTYNQINDFPGKTITRLPEGGRRPYTFSVIGDRVTVDASTGKVTGWRSGSAVITATDANRNSVSYTVSVSNCWMLQLTGWGHAKEGQANFVINRNALAANGFSNPRELTETEWALLHQTYGNIPVSIGPAHYTFFWTTAAVSGGTSMAYNQFNGTRTRIPVTTNGTTSMILTAV